MLKDIQRCSQASVLIDQLSIFSNIQSTHDERKWAVLGVGGQKDGPMPGIASGESDPANLQFFYSSIMPKWNRQASEDDLQVKGTDM